MRNSDILILLFTNDIIFLVNEIIINHIQSPIVLVYDSSMFS